LGSSGLGCAGGSELEWPCDQNAPVQRRTAGRSAVSQVRQAWMRSLPWQRMDLEGNPKVRCVQKPHARRDHEGADAGAAALCARSRATPQN